jgi:hypothetical protein
MPNFSDILKTLPSEKEEPLTLLKHINVFMFFCVGSFITLAAAGWYWKKVVFLNLAYLPLILLPLALVLQIFLEVRHQRKILGDSAGRIAGWLDKRFEEEKLVASSLDKKKLPERKRMSERLDSEIVTREKWIEVIKPFSILIPALLIIVTSDLLMLPSWLQGAVKLVAAAMLCGSTTAAIAILRENVKLRRLSSVLHYTVNSAEEEKVSAFRRVSRKRKI